MRFRINKPVAGIGCGLVLTFVLFSAQGGFTSGMPDGTRNFYIVLMVLLALVILWSSYSKERQELPLVVNASRVLKKGTDSHF